MEKKVLMLVPVLLIVLTSGCIFNEEAEQQMQADEKNALDLCVELCTHATQEGRDMSNGPCLSNKVMEGWVCDTVNVPRQAVDNLPENQCSAYGKTAQHFVELDKGCGLVRIE